METTRDFFTEKGKQSIEQAKKFGLYEYYDPMTGCYNIPMPIYNTNKALAEKIKNLLLNGNNIALELLHCDECDYNCPVCCDNCNNKTMISLREVEPWE